MTAGGQEHKKRKDIKWTDEITSWIKERCPVKEHGYECRAEILTDLNATFGTDFTLNAFVTHCYEKGVQLGTATSESFIARGEKHRRHREVGSLQVKKDYVRIKVAEPNKWMWYHRYIWEQNHPGESAEGMTVIFMDGNNRNFDPSNLERVTRKELSVMAELGHTKDMTREEREICLLRARIAIAKSSVLGPKEAANIRSLLWYYANKNNPERIAKVKRRYKAWYEKVQTDPELREKQREKQREYRRRNRDHVNAWAREYNRRRKEKEGK